MGPHCVHAKQAGSHMSHAPTACAGIYDRRRYGPGEGPNAPGRARRRRARAAADDDELTEDDELSGGEDDEDEERDELPGVSEGD